MPHDGRVEIPVNGTVAPGFDDVRHELASVLAAQDGAGAAVAVWHDGAWVVDLWGGYADASRSRPWTEDTLVMPYSVTKPFAAVCALLLHERGALDLDAPLQHHWPEMSAGTTLREVLCHRSGHVVLDEDMPASAWRDWDGICAALARQRPAWEPGTAHGESALFFGHLVGEVVRRVDGRSLGTFLRDEVCAPLGLDFHVGLPATEHHRVADLTGFGPRFGASLTEDRPEVLARALGNPRGALDPEVVNSGWWRSAEVPAVNGHGTARAVAALYVALAAGGLLAEPTVREMTRGNGEEVDRVVGGEPRSWGLGVAVEPDGWGMGGIGGSSGWWSDEGPYAFAYLTSHIADHAPSERVENAVRRLLDLPLW